MAAPTSRARVLYALRMTRLHRSFERALFVRSLRLLRDQAAAAATGFEEGGAFGAELALKDAEPAWQALLQAHYEGVGTRFAAEAVAQVAPEPKADFRTLLAFWIRTMSLRRARGIAARTVEILRRVIEGEEEEGRPVGEIARAIRGRMRGVSRVRAATIARTETGVAASWSMQKSVEQLSIAPRVKREWVAAEDARTRPSHADADAQLRGMSEDFLIREFEGDGDDASPTGRTFQMSRPKDPDGPAGEVINCRCVLRYLPPSFEEVLRG